MTMKKEDMHSSDFDELTQNDRISPLDFKEPELHDFDVTTVFELDLEPEKKSRTLFGKRQARRANVKIREDLLEEKQPEENPVVLEPEAKEEAVVVEPEAKDEVMVALEPEVKEEAVVVESKPEQAITTEDIEDEDEVVFAQSIEEELDEAMDEALEEMEDEEEEEVPSLSDEKCLYDEEEDLDLFEDKKRFFLSQYSIIEDYLREQSQDGYHFVRHEGKKYYFVEGEPTNYYYSIDYFKNEPTPEQWQQWESEGWKLISKEAGKKKKEAGWFYFRNLQNEGEYRKEIDNDEEKYRFFKKYSNSCRSTLFLIFICMFCCLVTAFLQYEFKGYLWGIAICAIVFLLSFIFFVAYYRMLRHSKKRVRLLKARLRVKEANRVQMEKESYDVSETEDQLESDWNTVTGKIEEKEDKGLKRRLKRSKDEGQ